MNLNGQKSPRSHPLTIEYPSWTEMSWNQKKANVTDGKGTEKRRFIQILGQFWASFVRKSSSSRFWSQLLPDNCEVLKKPLSHGEDMMRNGVGANLFTPVIFVGTQTHCSPYKKKATYDHFLSQNKNKERAFSTLRKWSCHSSEMMGVSFWLLVDFLNYVSNSPQLCIKLWCHWLGL